MNPGFDELKQWNIVIRQVLAEFIGTFLYLSLALLAAISHSLITEAFANGLLIASMIQIFGHISGGHVNPAVTIGILAYGDIKLIKSLLYIAAQVLGSIAGSAVAYLIIPSSTRENLAATIPHASLTAGQVFGIELLMTFLLVSVVIVSTRGVSIMAPLAIGLTVTACLTACGYYTGSLNPVRSLGPALIMNIWKLHWVYWAAPITGGILAGLFNRIVITFDFPSRRRVSVVTDN